MINIELFEYRINSLKAKLPDATTYKGDIIICEEWEYDPSNSNPDKKIHIVFEKCNNIWELAGKDYP